MSVQEIETAIIQLDNKDFWRLSDWLIEYRNQLWDKQIEDDLSAGRLDDLLDEADEEYKKGMTKPL